jgi:membrane protein YdbS with pleckstrin-like domain
VTETPEPAAPAAPAAHPLTTAGTPEPTGRLPRRARTLWRLETGAQWGFAVIVGIGLSFVLPSPWGTLAWALPLAGLPAAVLVWPELRWRRWRYEVRDYEIDLRHGAITIVRTLVPMQRVQHVDTHRGVLEQLLGLSSVVFHTAAGANGIPALDTAEAAALRDRIALLTRTDDDL